MNALEFISSIRWPITVLVAASFIWWRASRNPSIGQAFRGLLASRNLRLNVAGQELELAVVQEAAAIAVASDANLAARAAQGNEGTQRELRREAVERLIQAATRVGWEWGRQGGEKPALSIKWEADTNSSSIEVHITPDMRRIANVPYSESEDIVIWQTLHTEDCDCAGRPTTPESR